MPEGERFDRSATTRDRSPETALAVMEERHWGLRAALEKLEKEHGAELAEIRKDLAARCDKLQDGKVDKTDIAPMMRLFWSVIGFIVLTFMGTVGGLVLSSRPILPPSDHAPAVSVGK